MNHLNQLILIFLLFSSLNIYAQENALDLSKVDMQGHRGARGLVPENTIPAFIRALEEGVNTLELDVVISKDKKVVVSHEPYMSGSICTKPNGEFVSDDEAKYINIFEMTYDEISEYDCGIRGNSRFPEQEKMAVKKPLLEDLIKTVEAYLVEHDLPKVGYNIELKSSPKGDAIYHPDVAEFSDLVKALLDKHLTSDRYSIQSFDFRVLKYWFDTYEGITLVALIENLKSVENNIMDLGFKPAVYSPYYKTLNQKKIDECHTLGMKVIPWTVNDLDDIKKLIGQGVDGIITDYPNLISELKN